MVNPKLSIITCTFNGGNLLGSCLDSIFAQNYKNFEVLCVDGGSTDQTKDIIAEYMKKYSKIRLINNKKKLPEGKGYGKWLGFKKSRGEIVGIVDQDNVLQRKDLFLNVVSLFNKNKKIMTISAGLKNDLKDSLILRYISLFGTDSFFVYRSIDALRTFNKKSEDIERYIISPNNIILVGSNCLFYSKANVNTVGSYDQDVLLNQRLIVNNNILYVIKNSTKHHSEKSLYRLTRKKFMWGANYFKKNEGKEERFDYMPKTALEKKEFYKVICTHINFFLVRRYKLFS